MNDEQRKAMFAKQGSKGHGISSGIRAKSNDFQPIIIRNKKIEYDEVNDLSLKQRWDLIKELDLDIIKMPDKNGGFMEPIMSVNTYAMDAPYLQVISKGIPKLQKDLWYLFDIDDGLLGIYRKKSDVYITEKWERSSDGSYHTHGYDKTLNRGDHFSQDTLEELYKRAGGDEIDPNKRYIYGLDVITAICKKCGKERKLGSGGSDGHCKSCLS